MIKNKKEGVRKKKAELSQMCKKGVLQKHMGPKNKKYLSDHLRKIISGLLVFHFF